MVPGRSGALAALLLAALVPAPSLPAQGAPRSIAGTVSRATGGGSTAPVSGDWVVLHRVGSDAAAPIDSMRLRADGSYAFRYRASGDSNAVYFVSALRGGVAYFTPPTREASVRGGMADLLVFDTTSAPVPISVRSRSVIVTAPESATGVARSVIEVYEVRNDGSLTRVSAGPESPTFEGPLPDGVTAVIGGQGDISPEAIRVENGRLRVFAPLAPGVKQFSFAYEIAASTPTIAVHLESDVPALEVLVEDPRGAASGAGLQEADPVQVDGRPFKRFLGQDVVAPALVEVSMPGAQQGLSGLRVMLLVTAVGAAMLLGLGVNFMRGGPQALARKRTTTPESLAVEIAALDRAFEGIAEPTEQQKAEHYIRRAQLKGRLSAVLAKRDGLA